MFCIVEFMGGRKKTVVPDTWLSINNTLCLLPPKATDSDLEVLMRNLIEPGEGWQMLEVSSLETFESYSEAKKQLKKSKEMSQSETSSQRKRKKSSYLEDYATHDSDDGRPYTVFGEDFDEEAISENEWIPPLESSPHIKNVSTVKKTIHSDHRPWNRRFSQSQLLSQKENIDFTCDCQSSCHSTFLQVLHSMQKQLNRTNKMVQQLLGGQKQAHSQLKRILQSQSVNQKNGQEKMGVFSQDGTNFIQCAAEEVVLPTLENSREDGTPCLPTITPTTQPLTQEASNSNEHTEAKLMMELSSKELRKDLHKVAEVKKSAAVKKTKVSSMVLLKNGKKRSVEKMQNQFEEKSDEDTDTDDSLISRKFHQDEMKIEKYLTVETYEKIKKSAKPGICGDSIFIKNLTSALWSVEELVERSSQGIACPTKKGEQARPECTPEKKDYMKWLLEKRIKNERGVEASEIDKRLKKLNSYISSKITTVRRDLKNKMKN